MKLIIQTANVVSDAKNCLYPNRVEVTSASELRDAVKKDHVCAEYKNNYRNKNNFIKSNVVVMDCDNDHTENPDEWITPEMLGEMMPYYSYAIAFSRNHMREKNGRAARPKFHVYFEIAETTDSEHYSSIKAGIYKSYPFFDGNALDAARFIFGADTGECIWHEGWDTIDENVTLDTATTAKSSVSSNFVSDYITEGDRNNTMSHFAGRVLKKYGITEKAKDAFDDYAKKCVPPLGKEELNSIWSSALRFYNRDILTSPGYIPPEEFNDDFGSLKPDDYSDIGEAKALVKEYEGKLLYTNATEFISYNGICWKEDRQKAIAIVEEFLDKQQKESNMMFEAAVKALVNDGIPEGIVRTGGRALEKQINSDSYDDYRYYCKAKNYCSFVAKCRNYRNIINTLGASKPMISMDINKFDSQEHFLNTPEATYDLKKGLDGIKAHDPNDLITKATIASPGEQGTQLWNDALELFFCGDKDLIDYVQETVGLAAIGKVYEEALIIAYGEGRNGKSTFWNTIAKVLGSYSGTISADSLTSGCRRNVLNEIAELKGKRLVIAPELEEGTRLSTSTLKRLCSTDVMRGEKKYQDPFDFIPSHTVVLYTNHLPKVGACDEGTWRRLIVIPFLANIKANSDIKNYSEYLYENAAPAIMSWIIEGAKKVVAHGYKTTKPKVVTEAIAAYRNMNDWMSHFLDECCETGDGLENKSGELYEEYRAYCLRTGEYTRSNADFALELGKRGFNRKRKNSGMWVQGIRIKDKDFSD